MPSEDMYPEAEPEQTQEMPHYSETMAKMTAAGSNLASVGAPIDHRPTVSEQLMMRKRHLEHELAQVNAAIEHALNNAPTMALLDSIAKVGLR